MKSPEEIYQDIYAMLARFVIEVPWLFEGNNPVMVKPFAEKSSRDQAAQLITKYIESILPKTEASENKAD